MTIFEYRYKYLKDLTPKMWWQFFHKYLTWYVATEIKDLRRIHAQITQKEFAKRMNTSQAAIARFEKGRENVSISRLRRMAKVLGGVVKIEIIPLARAVQQEFQEVIRHIPAHTFTISSNVPTQYLEISL